MVVHGSLMNVLIAVTARDKSMGSKTFILGKDIPNLNVKNLEEAQIMGGNIPQKIMKNWQRDGITREYKKDYKWAF